MKNIIYCRVSTFWWRLERGGISFTGVFKLSTFDCQHWCAHQHRNGEREQTNLKVERESGLLEYFNHSCINLFLALICLQEIANLSSKCTKNYILRHFHSDHSSGQKWNIFEWKSQTNSDIGQIQPPELQPEGPNWPSLPPPLLSQTQNLAISYSLRDATISD